MMICETWSLIFHDRSSYVEHIKNHENKLKRKIDKVEQMHKKSKLSTDDIQTGSGSFSVSDTREVLYNVNIINLFTN